MSSNGILWISISNDFSDLDGANFAPFYGRFKEIGLLEVEDFFKLLLVNPEINLAISVVLSQQLYYKSIMASELSSQDAEHQIIKLIDYFKEEMGVSSDVKYKVSLTRQQIADLTGLRVETVIRAIKVLEKKEFLKIKDRKIFR